MIVTEEKLLAAGIYNDDPTKRLSREPELVWADAINEAKDNNEEIERLTDLIVGLNDNDYNCIGEGVMEDILLSVEKAELLRHNDDRIVHKKIPRIHRICNKRTRKVWDEKLRESEQAKRLKTSSSTPPPPSGASVGSSATFVRDTSSEDTDLQPQSKNRYELNNASLEALHEDLAKNETQQKLMKYIVSTCKRQVEQYNKQNHPDTEERPVAEIMVCLGVDGQPAAACQQTMAQDASDASSGTKRVYPDHLLVSAGGFHYGMKTLNANGELFEQAIDIFLSAWRDTTKRQEWFKFPKDPRQREDEHPWLLLAHYVDAAVKLSDSEEGRDISALDVYEFMLKRAKKYPLCMFVLLEMRLATVAKMMKNAERIGERGSVELFLTAVKFAMRVFAMTHKTEYMRLSCNILLWWNCASEAQRKIYSSFIFTQLTSNGVPIYHDLSVELSVKDIRQLLGKVYNKGLELSMEHACAEIPEREGQERQATKLRNKDAPSDSSTSKAFSTIPENFIKMYKRIKEMDLWAPDKPPILCRSRGSNSALHAKVDRLEVPGRDGGVMNASILESITKIGEKRVRDYFKMNYIYVNNRPVRSEKDKDHGVSLSKMSSTVKQLKLEKDQRIKKATCHTKSDIKNSMKISEISDEYNKIRNTNKRLKLEELPKSGMTHAEYAEQLSLARKKLMKRDTAWKEIIIEQINAEYNDNERSTEEDRASLLKDKLFTFPQSVTNIERYTKKINVEPIPM